MAHGTPDWGITAGNVTTHQLTDLGEAVARLDSPNRYDRRGDTVHQYSFEGGLGNWGATITPGGGVDVSIERARTGPMSARLFHDGSAGASAALVLELPYTVLSKIGFEAHVLLDATIDRVRLQLGYWDETTHTTFQVRWDATAQAVQYLDSAGSWTTLLSSVDLQHSLVFFHAFKLVADFDAGSWVRVLFDDRSFPLAVAGRVAGVLTGPRRVRVLVEMTGDGGAAAGSLFFDDSIVTQNET